MNTQAWGPIRQLAYVVDDLDASIQRWIELHGVGPWQVYRNTRMQGHYHGQQTDVRMHVGLSYQGDLQIELIQPVGIAASPYQHADGRARTGMHHIAWHSRDLDGDLRQARERGMKMVFEAGNGVVRVGYLEMPDEPGPLYEFIEAVPAVLDGFAAGIEASRRWNGIDTPISSFDFEA
jgi:methylmalonyl-CoA/ethylmalonyl-CoA epimerase